MITTIKVQFGIFFENLINRPDLLASVVSEAFPIFDAPPLNLPLPPEAPPEIPISQIKSSDGKWQLSISKIRADIYLNETEIDEENNKVMLEILLLCFKKAKEQSTEINRLVHFQSYIRELDRSKTAIELIQEKFSKKSFENTEELMIRFNQQEKISDFEVNNITIIENAKKVDTEEDVILIQRDINTRQDIPNKFTQKNVETFFASTQEQLDAEKISSLFS